MQAGTRPCSSVSNGHGRTNGLLTEAALQVLISFRGTEQTKVKDILVDINLSQADVELEDEPELSVFEKVWNRSKLAVMRRAGIAVRSCFPVCSCIPAL